MGLSPRKPGRNSLIRVTHLSTRWGALHYEWTKATIENPAKKAKHVKSFALYVDGNEVYAKKIADALESDLQPIVGRELITRMSKHSTNPADNPQPPARLHN